MIRRHFFLVLGLLSLVLLTQSCAPPPNYLAYKNQNFCAELKGTLNGIEFGAQIDIKPHNNLSTATNTADPLENYEIEISYLAPKELEGIRVSVARNPNTGILETAAKLGELSVSIPREHIKGWLLPAESLLLLSQEKIESVQKNRQGYSLTFEENTILEVDQNGKPLSFQSKEISFSVIWSQEQK